MPDQAVHVGSGKVRELFALGEDRLLLVASDRISTFDVVLPTEIPDKGRVLTGLSAFWFARTRHIVGNHLLELRADGRSTECRRLEMLPIECVVRGYLAGSGWKDYQATGQTSGHALPSGLRESERLPEPIFTPASKAHTGHDENISEAQAAELVGEDVRARPGACVALYSFGAAHAEAGDRPRRHEVRAGARRRRRPDPGTRRSRRIPRASGRPTGTRPVGRSRRSTSSSCATSARASAGTRPRPAPTCPPRLSPARAPVTSRPSSA